ncbi:hypothetical protein TKK_0007362 [Trichogramma kaykai]
MEVAAIGGAKYFLTLTDDHSRFTKVYFIKEKSQVPDKIKEFINLAETQLGKVAKAIRSDNGRKFINESLRNFYAQKGIACQSSCSYTPQQNGVAERKNRTIKEKAKALLAQANLPKRF